MLYLSYTESISEVAMSYRHDLVVALEEGRREDAIDILRRAWQRFHDVIAARKEDAT